MHLPTVRETIQDAALRWVCSKRGHRWRLYSQLPYGHRDYCTCCDSNRIVFDDGGIIEATKLQLAAADVEFGEALYEARWGEPPRRKMRHGEWPAV